MKIAVGDLQMVPLIEMIYYFAGIYPSPTCAVT
jgi:hypothetical protein